MTRLKHPSASLPGLRDLARVARRHLNVLTHQRAWFRVTPADREVVTALLASLGVSLVVVLAIGTTVLGEIPLP